MVEHDGVGTDGDGGQRERVPLLSPDLGTGIGGGSLPLVEVDGGASVGGGAGGGGSPLVDRGADLDFGTGDGLLAGLLGGGS